jgi:ABC-type dipeptide/oligopeptide/nickel transport system permease component
MLVVVTLGMMLANFATDLAYGFLDPRVRYD